MYKKYKKLLFDLDNTLVDDDENRKNAIRKVLIERNEKVAEEKLNEFINLDNQFWKDRAGGKIKDPYEFKTLEERTEWVRAQRFIKYFKNISLEEAIQINNTYIEYLKEKIVPIKNSTQVLQYLYEKGYEIYIITNSPTIVVKDKLEASIVRENGSIVTLNPEYKLYKVTKNSRNLMEKDAEQYALEVTANYRASKDAVSDYDESRKTDASVTAKVESYGVTDSLKS